MTWSNPNWLPNVPPPNTITLGNRVSRYMWQGFGGDTDLQSIAMAEARAKFLDGKILLLMMSNAHFKKQFGKVMKCN